MTTGQHTYAEIMSQPDTWADVLSMLRKGESKLLSRWRSVQPKQVLFTGCGSTYYLSLSAAAIMQMMTGLPCRGVPASEIVLYPDETVANPAETLLIAVSRSGTTTETGAAMTRFRQLGGKAVWGITCYPHTPVAQDSDHVLLLEAAQEVSVAQTRSFSSMLLATQVVAAVAGGNEIERLVQLPQACADLLAQYDSLAKQMGESQDLSRFFFLGSGPLYGMACEAMLKMKEMSISHSESYHFLEFRHGPKSMVDEHTLLAGLISPSMGRFEEAVLTECAEMGGTVLALSSDKVDVAARQSVKLPNDLPEWSMPALYLPVLQLMAYYRSVNKGLDPDNPRNLTAVVELNHADLVAAR